MDEVLVSPQFLRQICLQRSGWDIIRCGESQTWQNWIHRQLLKVWKWWVQNKSGSRRKTIWILIFFVAVNTCAADLIWLLKPRGGQKKHWIKVVLAASLVFHIDKAWALVPLCTHTHTHTHTLVRLYVLVTMCLSVGRVISWCSDSIS